jgi:hypothetical protein
VEFPAPTQRWKNYIKRFLLFNAREVDSVLQLEKVMRRYRYRKFRYSNDGKLLYSNIGIPEIPVFQ